MVQNPAPTPDTFTITCDGKPVVCRAGTSVAAALWENGIRHLSHSHKYGRPRGVTCARGHCTNCLMRVDGVPNVRTCETPVRGGMTVQTQDTGTFYGAGLQKALRLGSAWVPVGFYYKWFTRPATLSRFFLERIRPMTGVGRLPAPALPELPAAAEAPSTDLGHFETVVVGGGASGLLAARDATGPVLLIDENPTAGGHRHAALNSLGPDGTDVVGRFPLLAAARRRLNAAIGSLEGRPEVRHLSGARVVAGYHPDGLLVRQGALLQTARFDHLVWAAGALDTFGLFSGNDTPGLVGPRALYRLLTRDGMSVQGRQAVLIGGGMDFWLSAALLVSRGATVTLVVTQAGFPDEVAAAMALNWPLHTGLQLNGIRETGDQQVQATFGAKRDPSGQADGLTLTADLAVICRRGKPAYDIPYQVGADLELVTSRGGFVPRGCEGRESPSFGLVLPGGRRLTYSGEALGFLPIEQVTR